MPQPFELGSGAVSLGRMVVVHEAPTIDDARRFAARLEQAGIPALIQSDHDGLPNIPVPERKHANGAWVAVPSMMEPEAREILNRDAPIRASQRAAAVPSPFRALPSPPGSAWDVPPAPPSFLDDPSQDLEEQEIQEAPLPDSGPLAPRLAVAVGGIAFGTVLQELVTHLVTRDRLMSVLAATSFFAGEAWRLVTAGFVHFTAAHFLSNALFGVIIAVVLFGTHRIGATLAVWLAASVAGLSAEMTASETGALIAGASAGNYGLVGLWAKGQLERSHASLLPRRERLRTLGIILLLVPGALTPVTNSGARVAVIAHAAGFVMGFFMGYVFNRRIHPEDETRIVRRSRIGLTLALGVIALALAFAVPEIMDAIPR